MPPVPPTRLLPFAALLGVVLGGAPAAAELRCAVSKTSVEQFESVGLTVTDPRRGADADPGPLLVTMADSADHRHEVALHSTGRPGVWSGRFTPTRAGRYTGTAILARGEEREIGLVPLIRVRAGSRRGFVRLNPRAQRALAYSSGGTLFPIGVRLHADDVRPGTDWRALFARLRTHEVNYLEVPVPWPGNLAPPEQDAVLRHLDTALVEAERTGRLALQLRLEPPEDLETAGPADYEAHVARCARRWAYSPALGAFYLAGAGAGVSAEERARLVRAVRAADPHRHLILVPGAAGEARGGADLAVEAWNWQRPAIRRALLEVPDAAADGPLPLPGESSWQMLVLGGIGLPLWPYRTGAPDGAAVLERVRRLAKVAGTIPYQAGHTAMPGVLPVDAPGSFCRYGPHAVGWVAPEGGRTLNLGALPAGRYTARFWDPGQDRPAGEAAVWATGSAARLQLPAGLRAVYVHLTPTRAAPPRPAAKPKPKPPAKPIAKKAPAKKPAKPKPPTRTRRTRRR